MLIRTADAVTISLLSDTLLCTDRIARGRFLCSRADRAQALFMIGRGTFESPFPTHCTFEYCVLVAHSMDCIAIRASVLTVQMEPTWRQKHTGT